MADATAEPIVVAGEDLMVEKRLDRSRFSELSVVFEISSSRAEPVEVRITDRVPPSTPVGFHPRYHGSDWTLGEETVRFSRELGPGDRLETLYGIGSVDQATVDVLRSAPTVEVRPRGAVAFSSVEEGDDRSANGPDGTAEPTSYEAESGARESAVLDELFQAVTGDRERDVHTAEPGGAEPEQSGVTSPPAAVDVAATPADLDSTLDAVEEVVARYRTASNEFAEDADRRIAMAVHLASIQFHLQRIRSLLPGAESSRERGAPGEGTDDGRPDEASTDRQPTDRPVGRFVATARFGAGLPLFWLVAFLGLGTAALGLLVSPGPTRGVVLPALGGFVAVLSTIGWLYPEEALPLPALPVAVALAGLGILLYPFVLGSPRRPVGFATVVAGILITLVPVLVENRRWQLLGILER